METPHIMATAKPARVVWERATQRYLPGVDRLFHARQDADWLFPVTAVIETHYDEPLGPNETGPSYVYYQLVHVCGALEVRHPVPCDTLASIKKDAADWLYGVDGAGLYVEVLTLMRNGIFKPADFSAMNDKYQLSRLMGYGENVED